MTPQVIPYSETHQWVRFYIDHLPFETLAPIETPIEEVVDWRIAGLQEDYQEWGDYLHSPLALDWPEINPISE